MSCKALFCSCYHHKHYFDCYIQHSYFKIALPSAGPPGSQTGPADTHQKFMAALAKAALSQVHKACRNLHTCISEFAELLTTHL